MVTGRRLGTTGAVMAMLSALGLLTAAGVQASGPQWRVVTSPNRARHPSFPG